MAHSHLRTLLTVRLLREILIAQLVKATAELLFAVFLHLGQQESLFLLTETVCVILLRAISPHQIHIQRVADAAALQIVVGIDI